MSIGIKIGDRVVVRDRPWVVKYVNETKDVPAIIELEAIDELEPIKLTVISPPDEITLLPNQELEFDLKAFDSYISWSLAHRILGATLCKEMTSLSGIHYGRVELEAYQIAPTLRILSKPKPSLLIADDVGLGKTIEAGLIILELIARKRASHILIVTPPGLMEQWQDEMLNKFGLDFKIIGNMGEFADAQTELPAGVNPWDAIPRIITSIDFIKRDTVRNRALRKKWDLIVVDEAHYLSEGGTPDNPYRTQRTRLGEKISDSARGTILLTATPHNGYYNSFRSLIELIDPSLASFYGSKENVQRRIESACIRRMKSQIVRRHPDGREVPVFPKRHVSGIPVTNLTSAEKDLLGKVSSYCSKIARQAEKDEDAEIIGFAMQIIKKRAVSSREALKNTLRNRLEALAKDEYRDVPPTRAELKEMQADMPLTDFEAEKMARKIIKGAIPKDEKRRNAEIRAIKSIIRLTNKLPESDPKIEALINELRNIFSFDPQEKVIIFTEYRDTLEAIKNRFDQDNEFKNKYVIFHGGLTRHQRLSRESMFKRPEIRILLTTDAASEGLNFQEFCRRVIHFELPWNPNRLEQRNGRVDRYGQAREPIIQYLYYPDSPEDDVLNRLIEKIQQITKDKVSTPDILGVLTGRIKINEGLLGLDPESSELEQQKISLVRQFEDRTKEFLQRSGNILALTSSCTNEINRIYNLLNKAEPLMPDDYELENIVKSMIREPGICELPDKPSVYKIEVPLKYRGERVRTTYEAVAFRRSVAVKYRPEEVEFITPLHPLVISIAKESRMRLLQCYSSFSGPTPRRLAAVLLGDEKILSILFTFYGVIRDEEGNAEENIIGIRITNDGDILGDPIENLKYLKLSTTSEVDHNALEKEIAKKFNLLRQVAFNEATKWFKIKRDNLQRQREALVETLIKDLEVDIDDRLKEIEQEEKMSRIDVTGQQLLPILASVHGPKGFAIKKNAIMSYKSRRLDELNKYRRILEPNVPIIIGALFLVPPGVLR